MAKCKLSKELTKKICEGVRLGLTYKDSALSAGVSESTFYAWKAKGEEQVKGKYREFLDTLKKAQIAAEDLHIKNITRCSVGGQISEETKIVTGPDGQTTTTITRRKTAPVWQASAWLMERRIPERYGRNRVLENENTKPLPWSDDF